MNTNSRRVSSRPQYKAKRPKLCVDKAASDLQKDAAVDPVKDGNEPRPSRKNQKSGTGYDWAIFKPNEAIRKAWDEHPGNTRKLPLEESSPRNVKPLDKHHAIKRAVRCYFYALVQFWKYLELRGLHSEMILLLQYPIPPKEAGSFTPEYILDFARYKSELPKFKGKAHLSSNGEQIKSADGSVMVCQGGWGSSSSLHNFKSAVIKVMENLGHKHDTFKYPECSDNMFDVNVGHSFTQSTFHDDFKYLKHETGK